MSKLKALRESKVSTDDMHSIVVSLQELGIAEMQIIRNSVISTRDYTSGLLDIFFDIRISQQAKVKKQLEKQKEQVEVLKSALIFLSQNQRFSDVNISSVWRDFLDAAQKSPHVDLIIVGEVGRELARSTPEFQKRTILYFRAETGEEEEKNLSDIFGALKNYGQIVVYRGEFSSFAQQVSKREDVTGRDVLQNATEFSERQKRTFLFEPSLELLVDHFEQEVQRGIMKQSLHESRLAHLGSRIQTLEAARGSIETELEKIDRKYKVARRRIETRKQQQRLAGVFNWK
jgi:F0F1-type ATP synthase gamma subunit